MQLKSICVLLEFNLLFKIYRYIFKGSKVDKTMGDKLIYIPTDFTQKLPVLWIRISGLNKINNHPTLCSSMTCFWPPAMAGRAFNRWSPCFVACTKQYKIYMPRVDNQIEALYKSYKKIRNPMQMTNDRLIHILNYQLQANIHFNWPMVS